MKKLLFSLMFLNSGNLNCDIKAFIIGTTGGILVGLGSYHWYNKKYNNEKKQISSSNNGTNQCIASRPQLLKNYIEGNQIWQEDYKEYIKKNPNLKSKYNIKCLEEIIKISEESDKITALSENDLKNTISKCTKFIEEANKMSIDITKGCKDAPDIYSYTIQIGMRHLLKTKYNILKFLEAKNSSFTCLLKNFETNNQYWNHSVPEAEFASVKDKKVRNLLVEFFKIFI
jgi:hypothetical protein